MIRKTLWVMLLMFPLLAGAQNPLESPGWSDEQSAPAFSPEQLDNLVAPIALYPDQLLSQVLAASTYPAEVEEAQQWLLHYGNVAGPELLDAARQRNWDASVQALVAFPRVLSLLNRDLQWTTDLGNAFLSQQVEVMNAVQRMRARAWENGRLAPTPQQNVTTETQDGQRAIVIQPADPEVIYVPAYNPVYVWGAPAWGGGYPALEYPEASAGFDWGPAALIGTLFSGLLHWGGWGWALSWFTHSLFLNPLFFGHFGFGGSGGFGGGYGGGFGHGPVMWAHNPGHRMGVPYPTHELANRFHGGFGRGSFGRGSLAAGGGWNRGGSRPVASGGWRNFGGGERYRGGTWNSRAPAQTYHSSGHEYWAGSGANRGPQQGYREFSRAGAERASQFSRGDRSARSSFQSSFRSSPRSSFRSSPESSSRSSSRSWARASSYRAPRAASTHFSGSRSWFGSSRSSSRHFSSPHFSKPRSSSFHSSHSFGGHSGGGHVGGGHSGGGHSGGHSGGGHSHGR